MFLTYLLNLLLLLPTDSLKSVAKPLEIQSVELLKAVRQQKNVDSLWTSLNSWSLDQLQAQLSTDTQKIAFWVNLYNASYQYLYLYKGYRPSDIFSKKDIPIAGIRLSLDQIEHGILRKYRHKYSLGYMSNWFVGKTIKNLAVDQIDWRIHFALNCGAKSCPPISYYDEAHISEQLDLATESFLLNETYIDHDNKTLEVTRIMHWFRGDFGGKKGMKRILSKLFKKDLSSYSIHFQDYDWSPKLNYFSEK